MSALSIYIIEISNERNTVFIDRFSNLNHKFVAVRIDPLQATIKRIPVAIINFGRLWSSKVNIKTEKKIRRKKLNKLCKAVHP